MKNNNPSFRIVLRKKNGDFILDVVRFQRVSVSSLETRVGFRGCIQRMSSKMR